MRPDAGTGAAHRVGDSEGEEDARMINQSIVEFLVSPRGLSRDTDGEKCFAFPSERSTWWENRPQLRKLAFITEWSAAVAVAVRPAQSAPCSPPRASQASFVHRRMNALQIRTYVRCGLMMRSTYKPDFVF